MQRLDTKLDGPILIEPRVFGDERGFFSETYRRNVYEAAGIAGEFIQDNHSRSHRGVLRGLLPERVEGRIAGTVENDSVPALTENSALSS